MTNKSKLPVDSIRKFCWHYDSDPNSTEEVCKPPLHLTSDLVLCAYLPHLGLQSSSSQ